MEYLFEKLKFDIIKFIDENDTVIIALSGGKDSVTLTLLLIELQKTVNFRLIAAYFNHRIRKDYREEEKWVRNFCIDNNIKLEMKSEDVPYFVKTKKMNLEEGASFLRYKFFNSLLDKYRQSKIFTAHTQSDLTETFLIKLFRGSGLQGLTSISPKKKEKYYRPLLNTTKEEIIEFLKRNKIIFYEDYSNNDNSFLRNNIRNNLIPIIKEIQPNFENSILKTVNIINSEYDYFLNIAKNFLKENLIINKILPVSKITDKHEALKRHILREYIRLIKGNLLNIGFDNIENLIISIKQKKNISLNRLDIIIKNDYIFPANLSVENYNIKIDRDNSSMELKDLGLKLEISHITEFKMPVNNEEIIVSTERLSFPLFLRNPKKNDKYKKINSEFSQSVYEVIRSMKIPRELRNMIPLLTDSKGNIIWVYGSPVSDIFKIGGKQTKSLLKIKIYRSFN